MKHLLFLLPLLIGCSFEYDYKLESKPIEEVEEKEEIPQYYGTKLRKVDFSRINWIPRYVWETSDPIDIKVSTPELINPIEIEKVYIEKPVEKIVEKIIEKKVQIPVEVIKYVDRIVEKKVEVPFNTIEVVKDKDIIDGEGKNHSSYIITDKATGRKFMGIEMVEKK